MLMVLDLKERANQTVEDTNLNTFEKDGIQQGIIEIILEILRNINQIDQKTENPLEPGQRAIIIKKVTRGGCFRFLYSSAEVYEQDPGVEEVVISPREQEMVRLMSHGFFSKAIAAVLDISPRTVNTYIRRIFTQLNVSARVEMVAIAARLGLMKR
jgi:DNA-binding CsgD family transcriptional regulator